MNPLTRSEIDVAVIGAGAAGIAAARHLIGAGLSVLVLEAQERAGGRAHTVNAGGMPIDIGCEWLHSANRNGLVTLAELASFDLCRTAPEWPLPVRWNGEDAAAGADWFRAQAELHEAARRAAFEPHDRALSSLLDVDGRWNALLDAVSSWGSAAELRYVSARDHARYVDTGINWRVRQGLGRLIETAATGLPIAYQTVATCIDHSGRTILISTNRGTATARHVVITTPTAMIAEQRLRFTPALPDKVSAAAGLPLGVADKLMLGFDETMPESYMVGSVRSTATMNYHIRPMGQPRIQCFFGGELARRLEHDGKVAMVDFAVNELAGLLGNDIRRRIRPLVASFWRRNPFARGAYSYALPGHADDRAALAEPVDNRLFFAGEACSTHFYSTVHGAYESGITAAKALLRNTHATQLRAALYSRSAARAARCGGHPQLGLHPDTMDRPR